MKTAVRTADGVAVVTRGDVVLILYAAPARLQRTRWLFDRIDEHARHFADGILAMMVIPATADPPDAPTRAENAVRLKRLDPVLRRLVTVPLGDSLRVSLVRSIIRVMLLVQRRSDRHMLANTEDDGIRKLLEAAGPTTPSATVIAADLRDLHAALRVTAIV